jgi:hypothetical protein
MIQSHAGIVPRIKPGGMAILQIPQDLKERQHLQMIALPTKRTRNIWTIRPRAHLRSRLFRQIKKYCSRRGLHEQNLN